MHDRRRVIPALLLDGPRFVKTRAFAKPIYIGDPINCLSIFNQKCPDEIIILDISAPREGRGPQLQVLEEIASECFVPLTYGGGITELGQIERVLRLGFEKVAINSALYGSTALLTEASRAFGVQAMVASIDYDRNWLGRQRLRSRGGRTTEKATLAEHVARVVAAGAGEILLTSIERDGARTGYDLDTIHTVAETSPVPVIALGGCGHIDHIRALFSATRASAAACGSFCVLHPSRGVLITFPSPVQLDSLDEAAGSPARLGSAA